MRAGALSENERDSGVNDKHREDLFHQGGVEPVEQNGADDPADGGGQKVWQRVVPADGSAFYIHAERGRRHDENAADRHGKDVFCMILVGFGI